MEKRLICYNFIFSTCNLKEKCPFAHIIVKDKEEYHRKWEKNEDKLRDLTSADYFSKGFLKNQKRRKRKGRSYDKDNADNVTFINCVSCNATKCEKKSLTLALRQSAESYVCSECEEKCRAISKFSLNDEDTSFIDKLSIYM